MKISIVMELPRKTFVVLLAFFCLLQPVRIFEFSSLCRVAGINSLENAYLVRFVNYLLLLSSSCDFCFLGVIGLGCRCSFGSVLGPIFKDC